MCKEKKWEINDILFLQLKRLIEQNLYAFLFFKWERKEKNPSLIEREGFSKEILY